MSLSRNLIFKGHGRIREWVGRMCGKEAGGNGDVGGGEIRKERIN